MVWASRWSVALRAFYRQILSLTYSFFSLKLPPPACPGTTGITVRITITRMKDGIASVTLPGTRAVSGSVSVEFHVCGLKRYLVIQARAQEMIAQHGSFRSRNLIKQQYGTIETGWKDFHILFALLSTIHSTLLTFMSPHSSSNFNRWRTFCGVRAWILYDSYRQLTTGEHWSLVMSTISSNWQIRCFHQPGKL